MLVLIGGSENIDININNDDLLLAVHVRSASSSSSFGLLLLKFVGRFFTGLSSLRGSHLSSLSLFDDFSQQMLLLAARESHLHQQRQKILYFVGDVVFGSANASATI